MGVLGTFTKQPVEVLDYDIQAADWLDSGDSILTASTTADLGITVDRTVIDSVNQVVKIWVSGGTTGMKYHFQTLITTTDGRVKDCDFFVRVKET